ncbi:MAG: ABC transporter permease [Bacteroidales bacterium]|nr:ABC transporter permease [Bacteroidales bacterium]
MRKIAVVIAREYRQAVRKKSFLILTILGPLLVAALVVTPAFLSMKTDRSVRIAVVDETNLFSRLNSGNDKDIHFIYADESLPDLKQQLLDGKYDALLYVPYNSTMTGGMVYTAKPLESGVMSNILASMKENLSAEILVDEFGIDPDSLQTYIARQTDGILLGQMFVNEDLSETRQASYTKDVQQAIGLIVGLVIYFFIFMYCSMVLRSVLEEKTNRVVELIVSSVRPLQLMVGKIIGIALIGMTQLAIWIVLVTSILGGFKLAFPEVFSVSDTRVEVRQQAPANYDQFLLNLQQTQEESPENEFVKSLQTIDFTQLILLFAFFFVTGYFLYASLYAAVGAAVDNDADTQQFLLPLTVPLLLVIVLSTFITAHPDSPLAFWLSVIPFTSPIAMLIRIPFGVAAVQPWEILLSCVLMLLGCFASVWVAAKIYRTGILMYGKKISYKELWKWVRYRER